MKKSRISTILLVLAFLIGLSLLLYPSVSDYWNTLHSSRAIVSYAESVANLDEDRYQNLWQSAFSYNASLLNRKNAYLLDEEQRAQYEALLNVGGDGVMGYIEIPEIDVSLPIYHGTSDAVLQTGVGHLDWTSLPVGGESSHCVLSGHRGLPSAKLFTHLDKLEIGDIFCIRVLDEDKASVAVFPEGGIRGGHVLHPLRHGVFKIALRAKVPIVVCTLRGTHTVLSKALKLQPSQVELHLVGVIPAEELAGQTAVQVGERVYEMMARDLGPELVLPRTEE